MTHTLVRFRGIVALSLFCASCDVFIEPGGGLDGTKPLVRNAPVMVYDWSSDSRTLYFTAATGDFNRAIGIWSVDIASGRVRTIAATVPGNSGMAETIRVAKADGSDDLLYFAASSDKCLDSCLFRVAASGGGVDPLATNVNGAAFAASANGNHLLYTAVAVPPAGTYLNDNDRRDTLVVANVGASGIEERQAVGGNVLYGEILPLGVSVGGTVVYHRGEPQGRITYHVIDVAQAGGVPRELTRWPDQWRDTNQAIALRVVWRGEDPQLLFAKTAVNAGAEIWMLDGASDALTKRASIPSALYLADSPTWSSDGSVWAAWFAFADSSVTTSGPSATSGTVFRLLVQAPNDAQPRVILQLTPRAGWRTSMSPDGRHIAFLLGEDLYVVSTQ